MNDRPSRWLAETGGTRGESYAAGFADLAASGVDVHGEAALVSALAPPPARVLDGGCGTGRVAIELARRGHDVTGVDSDPSMLAVARRDAPHLDWRAGDLSRLDLGPDRYDVAVLAGNVLIFVAPGTESDVVARVAAHLGAGGLLVAGFQLGRGYALPDYDDHCSAAGLVLEARWATWDREPYAGGDYAVSVHRQAG
jgi:SAM-dependent methyltransferase